VGRRLTAISPHRPRVRLGSGFNEALQRARLSAHLDPHRQASGTFSLAGCPKSMVPTIMPGCFGVAAVILAAAITQVPPFFNRDGSELALDISPLGFWCHREGEMVIAIQNRSGHAVRFGVGSPTKNQAEWVGTYAYEFKDTQGGELRTTHHGVISCRACRRPVGGVCPADSFPVELPSGGTIAWRADVADVPVEKILFSIDLEVAVVPLAGLKSNERMVKLRATVPLDTVQIDDSCWQARRRPASP